MNIGIVGAGIVGRACIEGFRQKGYKVYINDVRHIENFDVVDKKQLVKFCDVIFICVPTPAGARGQIDLVDLNEVVDKLYFFASNGRLTKKPLIVIKSTVVPGTTKHYEEVYRDMQFACCPEFLRAEHALKDFLDPDRIVIGASTQIIRDKLAEVFAPWSNTPKLFCDPTTAEVIKYMSNAFLVLKVAYSCETKRICDLLGVNAEVVMDGITLDRRINKAHLNPLLGPIASDSPCLPKDLSALLSHLKELGYESSLLQMAFKFGVDVKNEKNKSS